MFWFIAFALAWAITVPLATNQLGYTDIPGLRFQLAFLIGLAPAIAAIIAAAFEKKLGEYWRTAWRIAGPWWLYLLALLLPLAFLAAPFGWAMIRGTEPPALALTPDIAVFAALWVVLAFGEELGWRSYALPRLVKRHGFFIGATILGVVWCVWHYPRNFASPDVETIEAALPFIGLFSLQIILANYIISWIAARARYGAVAPTIFHASFNTVSTIYAMAAIDLSVTAAIGAVALILLIFDRKPQPAD
jgi:membrane protease YdiL (CAAX protease family)